MSQKATKKPSPIKRFFTSRNTHRGAVSVVITASVIAAAILLNVILAILSTRKPMYVDVTANRNFKLQTVTVDYIKSLDDDVNIYVLTEESYFEKIISNNSNYDVYQYYTQANRLLHEFENNSDKIHLHYIDTVKNPTFLQKYKNVNRSEPHMILVESGENYNVIDASDMFSINTDSDGSSTIYSQHVEQAVTSAILKVADSKHVTVSVAEGLGEADCSAFTARLSMNAYDIEKVDLTSDKISDDSRFLIIYMPESDIDKDVYKTLSDWLYNNGEYGHNIIYFPNDYIDNSLLTNLNTLLADYGMEVENAYIFEKNSDYLIPGASNSNSTLFDYADTDFTRNLTSQTKKVVMGERGTLSVKVLDSAVASKMLVSSSDVALFDFATQELQEVDGPLCGAAIGRKGGESGTNSSVVTIGSAFAVTNTCLTAKSYNNAEYFINMFNVLVDNDVSIIIDGKDPRSAELGISSQKQIKNLNIFVSFVIPGLVLIAGLVVWIRRRHK